MAKTSVASVNTAEYDALVAVLQEARTEKKIGQARLAKRLGQSRNYFQKIEYRERRIDVIEFIQLAKALEIEPHELFDRVLKRIG